MTAALVCDNYKVEKFRKGLEEGGFIVTSEPYINNVTTMMIEYLDDIELKKVSKIIYAIDIEFERSN